MKVRIFKSRDKVELIRYSRGSKQIKSTFDISLEEIESIQNLLDYEYGD